MYNLIITYSLDYSTKHRSTNVYVNMKDSDNYTM